MPALQYYGLTLLLYIACMCGAIFIDDIAIVFDFVGAFGLSLSSFTIPGVLYLYLQ